MRAIGFGVTVAGLVLAGGLQAQVFMLQAPAPPAPPAQPAKKAMSKVQVPGLGSGSYLGVGVAEVGAERVKALKLKEERGVEITKVDEDSPALKAGLKAGDVVLDYNGQRIEGAEQFVRMVKETPEGRQVRLLISRDGNTQTLTATIAARKGFGPFASGPGIDEERLRAQFDKAQMALRDFQMPDTPQVFMGVRSGGLGIEAESITAQLAEYFGVKDGVLVRSVVKDSAAAKAGVKAGDVITKVDGTSVSQPQEITRALRTLRTKKTFPLVVVRNHKETTLSVTLEEPRTSGSFITIPWAVSAEHGGTRL
jgi:serine protease Do